MCIVGGIPGRRDLAQINENSALATQNMLPSGVGYTNYTLTNAATTKLEFLSGGWAVGCFTHLNVVSTTSGQNPSPMARFSYTSESVNSGWQLIHAGGTTGAAQLWGMETFTNNSFGSYFTSGTSQATVGDVFLGMTSDGSTTRRLIVNGKQEATTAANLNPITTTGALADFGAVGSFNGNYLMVAWNRDVSVGEWAWLNAEPYCYLRPALVRSRNVIVLSPATGTITGTDTVSAIGIPAVFAIGSATGTATVAATSNYLMSVTAAATGSDTVVATGSSTATSAASTIGSNASVAQGSAGIPVVGSSTGSASTVAAIGNSEASAAAPATGTATVAATSITQINLVAAATGTTTVAAIGLSNASTLGSTTGTATVPGTLIANSFAIGSATGAGNSQAFQDGSVSRAGVATGTSTVDGESNQIVAYPATAIGTSDAEAIGMSLAFTVGQAIGNSDDPFAVSESEANTIGNSTGSSQVFSNSTNVLSFTTGSIIGVGNANAIKASMIEAVGNAEGSGIAHGALFGIHRSNRPITVILG